MNKGIFLYPLIFVALITAFICFSEQANALGSTSNNRFEASTKNVDDNFLIHRSRLFDRIKLTGKNSLPGGMVRSTFSKEPFVPSGDSQRPSSISKKRHYRDIHRIDSNNPISTDRKKPISGDESSRTQITDLNNELLKKGVSITAAEGITESWVRQYASEPSPTIDFAAAIAVDASGNVYVTGGSDGSGSYYDYATIKYNTIGTELWVARYNGPGNGHDEATAIAVDASGNVYVTGYSYGSGTSNDYATIKYNEYGTEQWVARYNGWSNSGDGATAIAVDASGNVYVTGYSQNDYTTIKYSPTGTELWVAQNGPGNDDFAYAIAVDASGNVYVTGLSDFDYATIKYNTSGVEQWVARYNGPGNSFDDARAIAVDASGNVYVTGSSYGLGTSYEDYATIKYNTSGTEQWVARYDAVTESSGDEAEAIAVDASGNVYVTGKSIGSGTSYDYATVKYNASGTEQWVARYNGSGNSSDYGCDIAIDASGNVYVTGTSTGSGTSDDVATIMYNASGTEQWVARYDGPGDYSDEGTAIAVDASGNVYATGCSYNNESTNYEYKTVKYNATGIEQWAAPYNGPGEKNDYAAAIVADASGNVYVTGTSSGPGSSYDYTTIKYNTTGTELWVARYNGPANSQDEAADIAIDASGNVYVTGWSYGSGTSGDYATIKYNEFGTEQWVARYNGLSNAYDEATAIAVDASGNAYVTGSSDNDYTTIKYSSSGTEQWVARYSGPDMGDFAYDIAVDASGNVYVTGLSTFDCATIKYNTSGIEQWVARYNGPGNSFDEGRAIAVDVSGNVYVAGTSYGLGTAYEDYATIKYNSSGTEQWVARYNSSENSGDEATAIAIDASGNVYVTGLSYDPITNTDYATIKYNASGTEQWVARYNGTGNSSDYGCDIAIDASGNVYVTGMSYGSDTYDDIVTVKYSASGTEQWVARYNGPMNNSDEGTAIALDASGNVYVTGCSYSPGAANDYTTIKYTQSLVSDISLGIGWNMVSVPRVQSDYTATSIFPDLYGSMFEFVPGSAFVPVTLLELGIGYWLYYQNPDTVIIGGSAPGTLTFSAGAGWNIIGSRDTPLQVSSFVLSGGATILGDVVYIFVSGSGYVPVTEIKPGEGAWINVSADCTITF